MFRHHEYDLFVGSLHAYPAQTTEIRNGILYPFYDKAVTAVKLLTFHIHFISEDPCFHGHGYLGGTGGFGSVAYDPRRDRQCIHNGMGNNIFISAM